MVWGDSKVRFFFLLLLQGYLSSHCITLLANSFMVPFVPLYTTEEEEQEEDFLTLSKNGIQCRKLRHYVQCNQQVLFFKRKQPKEGESAF